MLVPLSLIVVAVGSFILTKYDSALLKRVFGGFTLLFTLRITIVLHLANTEEQQWPRAAGFFTGLFGGAYLGKYTHLKISEYVFRLVISVVLFATGVLLALGE